MVRPLRMLVPGGWYHLTRRGNRRETIYRTDADRRRFLGLMAELPERFSLELHAFVLTDNHSHLVVRTPEANLSEAMLSAEVRYVYDLPTAGAAQAGLPAAGAAQAGQLLIVQERSSANTPTVPYTRGRDLSAGRQAGLSGSLDGAGGIGGLLARSHGYNSGSWTYHNFYHADGNGNVTALVNSAGTLQASYIYDPFGRYLTGTGTMSAGNVMRFSSKSCVAFLGSATSGLYYYGYRFYDPYVQRWLNRDPAAQRRKRPPRSWERNVALARRVGADHANTADLMGSFPTVKGLDYNEAALFVFLLNNPIDQTDPTGLMPLALLRVLGICVHEAAVFSLVYASEYQAQQHAWANLEIGQCAYYQTIGTSILGLFTGYGDRVMVEICRDMDGISIRVVVVGFRTS